MKKLIFLLGICLTPALFSNADASPKKKKAKKHVTSNKGTSKADQRVHLGRTLKEKGFGKRGDTLRVR